MSKKHSNVVKFRRPININVGVVICTAIFLYLIIFSLITLSRDKITIYEVVKGQSANEFSSEYKALILRSESVTTAEKSGYINFYSGEASSVPIGGKVYAIDESGYVNDALKEAAAGDEALISDKSGTINATISQFNNKFNEIDFDEVYDFKYNLNSQLIDNITNTIIEQINSNGGFNISFVTSPVSGTMTHYTDGMEGLSEADITKDIFSADYKKKNIGSNDLVEEGAPIFKIVTSETWYLYIPLTDEDVEAYKDKTSLKIKILNDDLVTNADFEIISIGDQQFGKFKFDKYMIRYLSERFLDVCIYKDSSEGFKIPKSSVTTKEFYIIPTAYASKGGDSNEIGFNKQQFNEDGSTSVVFVTPTIYKQTDDYYYIDDDALTSGDVVVMNDSTSTYQVSATESLQGVYNVNAGYTSFRLIDIIAEANEYYIVDENTYYGLANYDNIILDASTVVENEVVFQ